MARYPVAEYAKALPKGERDHFATVAMRARDPYRAIAAYERRRRSAR